MAQLRIFDSLFDPDEPLPGPIPYQTAANGTWYRVFIFLEGPDLPFVHRVRYTLPVGFTPRHWNIAPNYMNQSAKLVIVTDKTGFIVEADVWVKFRVGRTRLVHLIRFHEDLIGNPPLVPSGSLAP